MTSIKLPELCNINGCRRKRGHSGKHDLYPTETWDCFMNEKDKNKINKAGYATPRGGSKGAYQNHVYRNNRVIIPFEKLSTINLDNYRDGYIIRLYPEQFFESRNKVRNIFLVGGRYSWIEIGNNAFILYRTHEGERLFPPLSHWQPRALEKDGRRIERRGRGVVDVGHYVRRIPRIGELQKAVEGAVQGIFAPEYADKETNYLSQCVLAWLIVHTVRSPYVTTQALHLQAILKQEGILDERSFEEKGVIRHGLCCCPLCLRFLTYEELHTMAFYEEDAGTDNAADQVEGATRSTVVNLFHLEPLVYDYIAHLPANVAWGHHSCNTRLGQRRCIPLSKLQDLDWKVAVIRPEGIETFGWISENYEMIRSPLGAVWIRISTDGNLEEVPQEPIISSPIVFDPELGFGTVDQLEERLVEQSAGVEEEQGIEDESD